MRSLGTSKILKSPTRREVFAFVQVATLSAQNVKVEDIIPPMTCLRRDLLESKITPQAVAPLIATIHPRKLLTKCSFCKCILVEKNLRKHLKKVQSVF